MADNGGTLLRLDEVCGDLLLEHVSIVHEGWELTAQGRVVARLHDRFSGRASGELAQGGYEISRMDRHGAFGITTAESEPVATFSFQPWAIQGNLDPGRYHIVNVGMMPGEFAVSLGNTCLLRLVQHSGLSAKRADVTITPAGRTDSHLGVLLLLLCHAYASTDDPGFQNANGFTGSGTFSG